MTLAPASPVFIQSQMPRMHCQNLITGAWIHRDVQGITSPSITWSLNNPNTFTCILAPPRSDMKDSTGNPVLEEWRDAIYLEENNQILWGGILTSSQINGPQWTITATGFGGYPSGMIYQGPNYTEYNIDALNVVRYIWAWLQSQPNGNLGLRLGSELAGVNVGAYVDNLASSQISRPASAGAESFWVYESSGFTPGMRIQVNGGTSYTIAKVPTGLGGLAVGEIVINTPLTENHSVKEPVLQVQTFTHLSVDANAGAENLAIDDPQGFTTGETILINGNAYNIVIIATNTAGIPTHITVQPGLAGFAAKGTTVTEAPVPFQLLWWNSTDCGQEIQAIQQEAVFDWYETHTWTDTAKTDVAHTMNFGVPRLGVRRTELRFAEGENITQPVQVTRNGAQFADKVIGLGTGSGSAEIASTVSQLSGRIARSYVYNDQTVTTQARMSAKANKVLASMQNINSPVTVVIKNHPNAPFGSFGCGDDIPVTMCTGWLNTMIWCRITSIQQDPTTNIMTLTVARSDSFSYIAETGQAGTI